VDRGSKAMTSKVIAGKTALVQAWKCTDQEAVRAGIRGASQGHGDGRT
jgi:hypothetical protein